MNLRLFDPATDDAAVLADLHAACFSDPWDARAIRELFAGPGVFAFFLADGLILARAAGGEAEILTLAVAPSARRRGYGRQLVAAAAHHAAASGASALFLEVADDNIAAQTLYRGLGFVPVGRRKAYYGGRDADVLKAILPLPNSGKFA
ncbi:MAG: GNAT family N-acetyltransferase [Alphaproteobacteria bacterium]|nr:GNAT family N-acetyltransferase [Alphaproteobacteria bacterium]